MTACAYLRMWPICFVSLLLWSRFLCSEALNSTQLQSILNDLGYRNDSNANPCFWPGINCTPETTTDVKVINISLSAFNLSGHIPSNIDLLGDSLVNLNLSKNGLNGSIPKELGNLINLKSLDLSQNKLTGPIPQEFTQLRSIIYLSLFNNNLNGSIPENISGLANLTTFFAYQNNLTGGIPSLKNATTINLASNALTGTIPDNLCGDGNLEALVLTNNRLNGSIPSDLGSCKSLTTLRIGQNSLTGDILSLGALENLLYFEADNNHLTGQMPSIITGWTKLNLLNLANNRLNGSVQLGNGVSFGEIILANNAFSGNIPVNFSQWQNLSVLDLGLNQLQGSLPDTICKDHSTLQKLRLQNNHLSGDIPASIGACGQLLELQLGSNNFSGNIPPEIGSLSNLQVSLNLSWNSLTGTIPASLGSLSKLVWLDLSHNQLSGSIPTTFGGLSSLVEIDLSNNNLTGSIPQIGPISSTLNSTSFENNTGLCGKPLGPCENTVNGASNKRSLSVQKILGIAFACAALVLISISTVVIILLYRHYVSPTVDTTSLQISSSRFLSEEIEKLVDFDSIKLATSSSTNALASNHFSTIYKVTMPSGLVLTAKKLKSAEKSILIHPRKATTELDKMLKLSHRNVMQPAGYFLEGDLGVILYDFVPLYTLGQRLHGYSRSPLTWVERYQIALGAAEGLFFLHHNCTPSVIHVDVSSNNIFLGPGLEVKLGDVEVAKLLDPSKQTGSISAVTGSFGYIAPEYAFTMRLTLSSNIYSFGVVLLELLTGRRPVDESFGDGMDLVKWVHGASSRGEMPEQILDSRIFSQSLTSRQEMLAVLKLAMSCTHPYPLKRPRMKKVLEVLQTTKLS